MQTNVKAGVFQVARNRAQQAQILIWALIHPLQAEGLSVPSSPSVSMQPSQFGLSAPHGTGLRYFTAL